MKMCHALAYRDVNSIRSCTRAATGGTVTEPTDSASKLAYEEELPIASGGRWGGDAFCDNWSRVFVKSLEVLPILST